MIKLMITVLMLSISINVSANDGRDKWPNNKKTHRSYKQHGQPFLTDSGLDYRRMRKHHKRAQIERARKKVCRGAQ